MRFQVPALVGLACRERNRVDMLVDVDEREQLRRERRGGVT
jgi:hypothetical protein